jgi:hypothetical protein
MPFYVPLGARGVLIHLGAVLTIVLGKYLYWRTCRRRLALES